MPNRIIKESICTSCEIERLTPEAEVAFYRIMVNVDDYGRMEADPTILRAKLFPRKIDKVKDQDIKKWLQELSKNHGIEPGLIYLYKAKGKQYLQITKWEDHQQIRAKRSKHPGPEECPAREPDPIADDINGYQMKSDTDQEQAEGNGQAEKFAPGSLEITLAEELKAHILRNNPKARTPENLQAWATEFDRMMRIDGRSYQDIKAVMNFSQRDTFWQANILSAKKLREKFDQLFMQSRRRAGGEEPQAWENIRSWYEEEENGGQGQ